MADIAFHPPTDGQACHAGRVIVNGRRIASDYFGRCNAITQEVREPGDMPPHHCVIVFSPYAPDEVIRYLQGYGLTPDLVHEVQQELMRYYDMLPCNVCP